MSFINHKINNKKGQVMLLMVMVISATILVSIVFASFALILTLRQAVDARASGEALFAADTGIECVLFYEFANFLYRDGCPPCVGDCTTSEVYLFANGPQFRFNFISRIMDGNVETVIWEAVGHDSQRRATRSLEITLRKLID